MFRIGSQRGITVDVDDPQGQMRALVDLLSGNRTVGAVIREMRARYPELSDADILGGIENLSRTGLVERAELTRYETEAPLSRYLGNINYFSHYTSLDESRATAQDRIREARVLLLGLGGGGSYAFPLLVAAGFGQIVAVDYDRVDMTNLNRQLMYSESDVGLLKTEVAERNMRRANSTSDISTVNRRINSSRDVAELAVGADVVICAIDEPPFVAQRRVNAACVSLGVPYVCGLSFVNRGRVFSVRPGESGCMDCLHVYYTKADPLFEPQLSAVLKQNLSGPTIAFAPHIAALSSFMVAEAVRLVTGHAPALSVGRQLELEYETGSWEALWDWPRYAEECPTCGNGTSDKFSMYEDVLADLSDRAPAR